MVNGNIRVFSDCAHQRMDLGALQTRERDHQLDWGRPGSSNWLVTTMVDREEDLSTGKTVKRGRRPTIVKREIFRGTFVLSMSLLFPGVGTSQPTTELPTVFVVRHA